MQMHHIHALLHIKLYLETNRQLSFAAEKHQA